MSDDTSEKLNKMGIPRLNVCMESLHSSVTVITEDSEISFHREESAKEQEKIPELILSYFLPSQAEGDSNDCMLLNMEEPELNSEQYSYHIEPEKIPLCYTRDPPLFFHENKGFVFIEQLYQCLERYIGKPFYMPDLPSNYSDNTASHDETDAYVLLILDFLYTRRLTLSLFLLISEIYPNAERVRFLKKILGRFKVLDNSHQRLENDCLLDFSMIKFITNAIPSTKFIDIYHLYHDYVERPERAFLELLLIEFTEETNYFSKIYEAQQLENYKMAQEISEINERINAITNNFAQEKIIYKRILHLNLHQVNSPEFAVNELVKIAAPVKKHKKINCQLMKKVDLIDESTQTFNLDDSQSRVNAEISDYTRIHFNPNIKTNDSGKCAITNNQLMSEHNIDKMANLTSISLPSQKIRKLTKRRNNCSRCGEPISTKFLSKTTKFPRKPPPKIRDNTKMVGKASRNDQQEQLIVLTDLIGDLTGSNHELSLRVACLTKLLISTKEELKLAWSKSNQNIQKVKKPTRIMIPSSSDESLNSIEFQEKKIIETEEIVNTQFDNRSFTMNETTASKIVSEDKETLEGQSLHSSQLFSMLIEENRRLVEENMVLKTRLELQNHVVINLKSKLSKFVQPERVHQLDEPSGDQGTRLLQDPEPLKQEVIPHKKLVVEAMVHEVTARSESKSEIDISAKSEKNLQTSRVLTALDDIVPCPDISPPPAMKEIKLSTQIVRTESTEEMLHNKSKNDLPKSSVTFSKQIADTSCRNIKNEEIMKNRKQIQICNKPPSCENIIANCKKRIDEMKVETANAKENKLPARRKLKFHHL